MKKTLPKITLPKRITESMLVQRSGVPQSSLNLILRGRRRANPRYAKKLAAVCEKMGLDLSLYDWLYPEDSPSPLILKETQPCADK